MEEEELASLALECFEGDADKAVALLKLIKLSLSDEHVYQRGVNEDCRWCKEGQCWLNMPDSLRACTLPCSYAEKRVEY